MTVQELADISGVKELTIRTNITKVVGATQNDDGINIPEGSRYPYDVHKYKFNSREKRIDALLEATFHFRYVDEKALMVTKESFQTMIEELLNVGLLQQNGSDNPYGANRYDTTILYDQVRSKKCKSRVRAIVEVMSSATGNFAGGFANSYISF